MKTCTKCGIEKDLTDFAKRNDRPSGYLSQCKVCKDSIKNKWYRTPEGLVAVIYDNQLKSSVKRKHQEPEYSKEELLQWILTRPNFNSVFNAWVNSNYHKDLIPSIDRLNNSIGYTFDNIELVTFTENNQRGHVSMSDCDIIQGTNPQKAVIQCDLIGNEIARFSSIRNASRATGFLTASISRVYLGERSRLYGYTWKFA